MNSTLKHLILFMVLLHANEGYSSDSEVLSLASDSWKKTREVYLQTAMEIMTARDDVKHDPSNRDYSHGRTEVFRIGSTQLLGFVHLDNEDDSEMQNVYVQNPQYGFSLARRKDSDPWQLVSIVSREAGVVDWFSEASIAPWSILDIDLVDVLEDPSFQLISIANDRECQLVSFELNSAREGTIGKLRSCRLRICPARNYLVDAFDAEFESDGGGFRGVGTCTYDGIILGVPRLQSYDYKLIRANKKTIEWTTKITRLEKCTKSKSEFKLSAFGFAEPTQPTNMSPLVWLTLLAISLLGIGLFLRRTVNRR